MHSNTIIISICREYITKWLEQILRSIWRNVVITTKCLAKKRVAEHIMYQQMFQNTDAFTNELRLQFTVLLNVYVIFQKQSVH